MPCHCRIEQFNGRVTTGYAQMELEQRHPGSIALFFAGCGADQNPLPRRTVELAQHYGRHWRVRRGSSADDSRNETAVPQLACEYREIELPWISFKPRRSLESSNSSNIYESLRAKQLLTEIDNGMPLKPLPTYPFRSLLATLGNEWILVALGGEVVVDYSLRIKANIPRIHFRGRLFTRRDGIHNRACVF